MAYIGKEPIVGNFQKCDAITVVNGQAAYTLQVSSTNVVPESENHMLVSLNGILQAPVTSFSVSGSTLTFVSNLATGDVIDFVILLGNVLDLGTPSDGTVTNAKLAQDIISGETALTSAPAATDEFLVSDAGTLKRVDASLVGRGKILQVVSTAFSGELSTTSTTFVTCGFSADITPSATSSKIAIWVSLLAYTASTERASFSIFRDSTNLGEDSSGGTYYDGFGMHYDDDGPNSTAQISFNKVDSPSSTSSITYTPKFVSIGGGTVYSGIWGVTGSITLMEIGA